MRLFLKLPGGPGSGKLQKPRASLATGPFAPNNLSTLSRPSSTSPQHEIHVLCVKSILAGSSRPNSLNHGNGIVAIHKPSMTAASTRVHNGSRNIYERNRMGLNCGNEGAISATRRGLVWRMRETRAAGCESRWMQGVELSAQPYDGWPTTYTCLIRRLESWELEISRLTFLLLSFSLEAN
jgi:hypothetical protein